MTETINIPQGLTAEQMGDFILAELIKRGINPDTIYPLGPPDYSSEDNDRVMTTTMTISYEKFPSEYITDVSLETPVKVDKPVEHVQLGYKSPEGTVRRFLQDWYDAILTGQENKNDETQGG